jgi:hypothetical protein
VNRLGVLTKRDDPLARMLRSNSRKNASAIDGGIVAGAQSLDQCDDCRIVSP